MSLTRFLFENHPEVLIRHLESSGRVAIAVLDEKRRVIKCNQRFREIAGNAGAEGRRLEELARSASQALSILPSEGRYWKLDLVFASGESEHVERLANIFCDKGRYFVFIDGSGHPGDAIVNEMASLNAEMADLNRELRKKQIALEAANDTIARLARTDPLTGLANRRHFNEALSTAHSASLRHSQPLSVAIADLDHFKAVNDMFGHGVGDTVLKVFAKALRDSCRHEDLPARWGGEEFIVLMPSTLRDQGSALAERARAQISQASIPFVARQVTASFGVAQLETGDTEDELIRRADKALYAAKEQGRNRVVAA